MGIYKDELNTVAHDFNSTTITINDEHNATGVEGLEVSVDEDRISTQAVSDGTAVFNKNPIKTGSIALQILESSPTSDYLWDLYNADGEFSIGVVDANAPNLKANGRRFRVMRAPNLVRARETNIVEWVFSTTYLNARGGSYSLSAE